MLNEKSKLFLERYRKIKKVVSNPMHKDLMNISFNLAKELKHQNLSEQDILLFDNIFVDLKTILYLLQNKQTTKPKISKNTKK